jgi:hypothetical protein
VSYIRMMHTLVAGWAINTHRGADAVQQHLHQRHLQLQRDRQTLGSPLDGWVARTDFEPGELVPAGAPVVVAADWWPSLSHASSSASGRPSIRSSGVPSHPLSRD